MPQAPYSPPVFLHHDEHCYTYCSSCGFVREAEVGGAERAALTTPPSKGRPSCRRATLGSPATRCAWPDTRTIPRGQRHHRLWRVVGLGTALSTSRATLAALPNRQGPKGVRAGRRGLLPVRGLGAPVLFVLSTPASAPNNSALGSPRPPRHQTPGAPSAARTANGVRGLCYVSPRHREGRNVYNAHLRGT